MMKIYLPFLIGFFALPAVFGAIAGSPSLKKMVEELPFESIRRLDKEELIESPVLTFAVKPENQIGQVGSTIALRCEASGIPVPVIYWMKDGKRLEATPEANNIEKMSNSGLRTYQNGGITAVLQLPCAEESDSGSYTCVAENGYERIESSATVLIEQGNDIGEMICKQSNGVPAYISLWSDMRLEREFANVQMTCRAKGEPKPKIFWLNDDDDVIENGRDYQLLPNGDLLVKNAEFSRNGGTLKCVAVNKFGEDRQESFLYPTKYDGEDEMETRKRRRRR